VIGTMVEPAAFNRGGWDETELQNGAGAGNRVSFTSLSAFRWGRTTAGKKQQPPVIDLYAQGIRGQPSQNHCRRAGDVLNFGA
jgi:hypothetical protein